MILAQLKELDLQYKSAAVFGLLAFFLSIVTGFIVGNNAAQIFMNSMFMTIFFILIGYGIINLFRKFVPELFELFGSGDLNSVGDENDLKADGPEAQISEDLKADEAVVSSEESDSSIEGEAIEPLAKDDFSDGDNFSGSKGKNLGKHIVLDEKKIKYEPKIMAEAVRTMMKRDD